MSAQNTLHPSIHINIITHNIITHNSPPPTLIFSTSLIFFNLSIHSVYFCFFNVLLAAQALKQQKVNVLCLMGSLRITGSCLPPYPLTFGHNGILVKWRTNTNYFVPILKSSTKNRFKYISFLSLVIEI